MESNREETKTQIAVQPGSNRNVWLGAGKGKDAKTQISHRLERLKPKTSANILSVKYKAGASVTVFLLLLLRRE